MKLWLTRNAEGLHDIWIGQAPTYNSQTGEWKDGGCKVCRHNFSDRYFAQSLAGGRLLLPQLESGTGVEIEIKPVGDPIGGG